MAFSGADEFFVLASFLSEQDFEFWPHQGVIANTDERLVTYSALFRNGAEFGCADLSVS